MLLVFSLDFFSICWESFVCVCELGVVIGIVV